MSEATAPADLQWTNCQSVDIRADTWLRRLVDVIFATTALVLLFPLLLVVAVVIKIDSRGPAFYRQQRVGRFGRTFVILKFRSMVADAQKTGPLVSGRKDPRITRVGAFLRSTKLDEMPQFVNVIKGEMTLIGPRAEVMRYIPHYSPQELQLLAVRPGLTGPGQLLFTLEQAAELDEADDPDAFYVHRQLHGKLALDLEYLSRRSLWVDTRTILRTIALPLGNRKGRRSPAPIVYAGRAP
jgi:lipopolysaccharide/colanic/teichoic acid biosynthesis glycosyltransferase